MQSGISPAPLTQEEYQQYFEKGISYDFYLEQLERKAASGDTEGYAKYIPQNFQRSRRIAKTLHLSDELQTALSALPHKLYWLVISELWCGDASQTLPVIQAAQIASNGKIDLRIVYRDENPDLMNAHLTNGTRSIPKLIQFDQHFNLAGVWGPRPAEAQKLVLELKSNPETAPVYLERLHKWYADDKTVSTQREIAQMLNVSSK
jgi:hypothetical protein